MNVDSQLPAIVRASSVFGRAWAIGLAAVLSAVPIGAIGVQNDIAGPAGSNAFGSSVMVLANGNIVVTDPNFALDSRGAVYLYSPAGVQLGALTGSTKNDHVGSGGVAALDNGNFVVVSPLWANGGTANAGAVTFVDGVSGLTDTVSSTNSLVGSKAGDQVGGGGVVALASGNYVVASPNWSNGGTTTVGAATWGSGTTGIAGAIGPGNSLTGTKAGDHVAGGGINALSNGNYVVASPLWTGNAAGAPNAAGAATWGSGATGIAGPVDSSNSLVGAHANDHVSDGGVAALANGNYVVASSHWANGTHGGAGAVTWGNGATGVKGAVTSSNSLVGTTANDLVGNGGVTVLTNGNYVAVSNQWSAALGAVTWGDGASGVTGEVGGANSLVGSIAGDQVGESGVTALTNGNYVVASRLWNNGGNARAGAATWGNGATGTSGAVGSGNSLVGGSAGDRVGSGGVAALSNGNYAVSSPLWDSVAAVDVGAVTWGDGAGGSHGTVLAGNSLTGSTASDQVGSDGVLALTNGDYVACSSFWDDPVDADVGAVTWAEGSVALIDVVSAANSLVGSAPGDRVCSGGAVAVGNGNVVIVSPSWNGIAGTEGAVTWLLGNRPAVGAVSALNSLTGSSVADQLGSGGVRRLANGDYAAFSPLWDDGGLADAGAVTIGRGAGGSAGGVTSTNSVRGTIAAAGAGLVYAYDGARDTLVVGQPAANLISLFKAELLFANGFD